jgi:hypothetical protein
MTSRNSVTPEDLGRFARRFLKDLGSSIKTAVTKDLPAALDKAVDADKIRRKTMAGLIEAAAARYPISPGATYTPGKPLEFYRCQVIW